MYRPRIVRFETTADAFKLISRIGCDPLGVSIMAPKAIFKNMVLENVPTKAANLLKQTFLAKGAEVAVARGTADLSVESTNVLISGTLKHYRLALAQLKNQPWGLPDLAAAVEKVLACEEASPTRHYAWRDKRTLDILPGRTLIMGILNLTPDSFSDGGWYNSMEAATQQVLRMIGDGADIIDIGAESTRPHGTPVGAEEEMRRLMPVLEKVLEISTVPVSVDTYKPDVARAALERGAHILNDVWGLQRDPLMAEVAAKNETPVVVMHNRSSSEEQGDIMTEIVDYLSRSIELGIACGLAEDRFIIDPGIGFGKTGAQNLEILSRLHELKGLGHPILVGTSRKRFLGDLLGLPVNERVEGTGATAVHAILHGANILRVHDVLAIKRMAVVTDALMDVEEGGNG